MTIISVADPVYFNYLHCLVKSAEKYCPWAKFHAYLINPEKEFEGLLKSSHSDIEVTVENKEFRDDHSKRCYCANKRAYLMNFMSSQDRPSIWIDADSIIRAPCEELKDICLNYDFSAKEKPPKSKSKFASGVICIGTSEAAKKFTKIYKKRLRGDDDKNRTWCEDQFTLGKVFKEIRSSKYGLKYCPLPPKYCDTSLSEEGIIWAAKSNLKESQKYQEEIKKYG